MRSVDCRFRQLGQYEYYERGESIIIKESWLRQGGQAAEDAETDQFNPAIDAASGAEAEALQNGKIQNKCVHLLACP